jgi:trans-aconitate 2-methyltransferase
VTSRPRDWDAKTYQAIAVPHEEWANGILDRLELQGNETVLDAGCGSGRVTKLLLERLPNGRVIGVDGSPSMIESARGVLDADRTTLTVQDLLELELDEPVDAVFSCAVFHWIKDHDTLFQRLHAVMKPGARMAVQCGGAGNIGRFHEHLLAVAAEDPYKEHFDGWEGPWNYATPAQTAPKLEGAGFTDVDTWLQKWDVTPPEPREYARTICLGNHLERLPEELKQPFVDDVCDRAGDPLVLDYVRLNIDARKPA